MGLSLLSTSVPLLPRSASVWSEAGWLVGGSGLLQYMVTGLAGSLIGGFLLDRLGIDLSIRNPLGHRIATATVGAVIVVLLARLIG